MTDSMDTHRNLGWAAEPNFVALKVDSVIPKTEICKSKIENGNRSEHLSLRVKSEDNFDTNIIKAEPYEENISDYYNDVYVKCEDLNNIDIVDNKLIKSEKNYPQDCKKFSLEEYVIKTEDSNCFEDFKFFDHSDVYNSGGYGCINGESTPVEEIQENDITNQWNFDSTLGNNMSVKNCIYKGMRREVDNGQTKIQKDTTGVKMYKCGLCVYQSNRKLSLTNHMLLHSDLDKTEWMNGMGRRRTKFIKVYRCKQCSYESKRKANVERHMLVHADSEKMKLLSCNECDFETKHKRSLETHVLIHRDLNEVPIYFCKECSFQSRYKGSIHNHVIKRHRDIKDAVKRADPLRFN